MIDTKYAYGNPPSFLFTVELLHKYFADQLCNDFLIVPTLETQRTLSGHRIVAKQYGNTLYAGVSLDPEGLNLATPVQKPFIEIEEGMQLTFTLQLKNPLFTNYTNIPPGNSGRRIFYFTNRNNNIIASKNFLSAKLQSWTSGSSYSFGDLVVDSGLVYESIRHANSSRLSVITSWATVDINQYVSAADSLKWIPSVSQYPLSSAQSSVTIIVNGYDPATGRYTNQKTLPRLNFPNPVRSFPLDLSNFPAGKYILEIQGDTVSISDSVYLNDALSGTNAFGIIDIFNEGTYGFLDSGQLHSSRFSINFLNRSTIWKYNLQVGSTDVTITDNNHVNPYQFSRLSPGLVVSTVPIPLCEKPLSLTCSLVSSPDPSIPSASPERLSSYGTGSGALPCSEIFLNY